MDGETSYLMMIEDDYADLILELKNQRRSVFQPDQANDIPLTEAVAACQAISAKWHEDMRPYETMGGMLT